MDSHKVTSRSRQDVFSWRLNAVGRGDTGAQLAHQREIRDDRESRLTLA